MSNPPTTSTVTNAQKIPITDEARLRLRERLARSKFRSRFKLSESETGYLKTRGMETIRLHALDFIRKRIAPAKPKNDGKQTPMKGHPVFIAQHATGTCCRSCLKKWHGMADGKELTDGETQYVVSVIMRWISGQMKDIL